MTMAEQKSNFMRQFRSKTNKELMDVTAPQLLMIWNHYDTDGNGYLEGTELDSFLREFVTSATDYDGANDDMVVSDTMLEELKEDFMDAYDDNEDGRIEIRELANMLPIEENFLLLFQLDNRLQSSVEFMQIWRKYDKDNSGSIEAEELENFLEDLIRSCKPDAVISKEEVGEYAKTLIQLFDENKDGTLQLNEMSRLLPVEANALELTLKDKFMRGSTSLEPHDIERVFSAYDTDKSGSLEGEELFGMVKDLMALIKPHSSSSDVTKFHDMLLQSCDLDGDGRISRDELTMLLLGLQHYNAIKR